MPGIHFIKTISDSRRAVNKLLLISQPIVGVTCKGVELGRKGELHLVAISDCDGDTYIFDTRTDPDILIGGKVHRILQSNDILKVLHDCSGPAATLLCQHGVHLRNYFDTQMAYTVLMEQQGLPPRRLRLRHLCEIYAIQDVYIPSLGVQNLIAEDRNVWAGRPLNQELQMTVASETAQLPVLYDLLDRALPPAAFREWFKTVSEENRNSKMHQTENARLQNGRSLDKFIENIHDEPRKNQTQTKKLYLLNRSPETPVR